MYYTSDGICVLGELLVIASLISGLGFGIIGLLSSIINLIDMRGFGRILCTRHWRPRPGVFISDKDKAPLERAIPLARQRKRATMTMLARSLALIVIAPIFFDMIMTDGMVKLGILLWLALVVLLVLEIKAISKQNECIEELEKIGFPKRFLLFPCPDV